jgi:urease accessory protein
MRISIRTVTRMITTTNMDTPTSTESIDSLALLRLLQLVSPALPIGAFNFSQGLEYAIEAGWIRDEEGAHRWIVGVASHGVGTLDIPLLARMHTAWSVGDAVAARALSRQLIASRETCELREEDRHLGRALAKVLIGLDLSAAEGWQRSDDATLAVMFSLAAVQSEVPLHATCAGYLWAWCENQVIAAVKLLPLGQSAGQRVLERLRLAIPTICKEALLLSDDQIGTCTAGVGIASARHETQYTRLFRS